MWLSNETASYGVSGITAYANGLVHGGLIFIGSGDKINLSVSHDDRQGYTFKNYSTNSGTNDDYFTMGDEDVVISAVYEKNTYHVFFNENNGTNTRQDVEYGDKAQSYTPTKDDCEFLGWYCGNEPYDFNTPVTKDTWLTAKWNENQESYTVTVKLDKYYFGHTSQITVKGGHTIPDEYKNLDLSGAGFVFYGWYDEDGNAFDPDTPITGDTTIVGELGAIDGYHLVTLYVAKLEGGFRLTYPNEDGCTIIDDYKYFDVSGYNYDFVCWYDEDGNVFDAETPVTREITLTGEIRKMDGCCEILFLAEDGTLCSAFSVTEGKVLGERYNSISYSKKDSDYIFVGWYTLDGVRFDFTQPVTSDITVKEKWKGNWVEVGLVDFYGETINTLTITPDNGSYENVSDQIFIPTAPEVDGYTFKGWKVNNSNTVYLTTDETKAAVAAVIAADFANDVTVTAYYEQSDTEQVLFTVDCIGCTLKNSDGEVITDPENYEVSEQLYAVADKGSSEQVFSHWEICGETVAYETTYAFLKPDKNMVLSAVYVDAE